MPENREIGFNKLLDMVNAHYIKMVKRKNPDVKEIVPINSEQLNALLGTFGLLMKLGLSVRKEGAPENKETK